MATTKIACLQLQAFDLERAEDALAHAFAMIDAAGQERPDLMVLPECTYPAYYLKSVEAFKRANLRPYNEITRLFGERARQYKSYIVVGIARLANGGKLLNSAHLFSPEGKLIGTYSKSFLWHFDQHWFDPGTEFPTFALPFGSTGIFVCADGRMPEIARLLRVRGARLLIDSTAWVTGGGDRATLSNPQFEYMIPTRAIENQAWVAVANKVGIEAESVLYCGRSCIVSPQGKVVVAATTTGEEFIVAEVDLEVGERVPVRRRPECYTMLGIPTDQLPVTRLATEPMMPSSTRVGVLQFKPHASADGYLQRVSKLTETLVRQDSELVVLPAVPRTLDDAEAYSVEKMLAPLQALSRQLGCGMACPLITHRNNGKRRRTVYLLSNGEVIGSWDQAHASEPARQDWEVDDDLHVVNTPYGRIGVMQNEEGLLPEVARVLMLKGADLILWPATWSEFPLRTIARTRADENRVFVVLASPLEQNAVPQTAIISPLGSVLSASLPDIEQAIAGQITWALTRYKEMAPNTNVVLNRQPGAFGELGRP